MTALPGLSIKQVAQALGVSQSRLRQHLVETGAITKTPFGWAATPEFYRRGLIYTATRSHTITTDHNYIPKPYTVALITGDGLAWLQAHQLKGDAA